MTSYCASSENTFIRRHSTSRGESHCNLQQDLISLCARESIIVFILNPEETDKPRALCWTQLKHRRSIGPELEALCFNTWNGNIIDEFWKSAPDKTSSVCCGWSLQMSDSTSGHVRRRDLTSFICRRNVEEASADFTWKRAEKQPLSPSDGAFSSAQRHFIRIRLLKLDYNNTFTTQHDVTGGSWSYFLIPNITVRYYRRKAVGAVDSNMH